MPSALGIAFFHKHWGAYEANPLIESDPLKKARQLLASVGLGACKEIVKGA
jgi:hypothetical protein